MKLLVLDSEDVRRALPMVAAIEAMKMAFGQLSAGSASLPLRSLVEAKGQDGTTLFMPAFLHDSGDMAVKIVSVYPNNPLQGLPTIHAAVLAIDASTGSPSALLEGASLTAIRTGAASGAATDLLARSDARSVAIFGSGVQARTQLEAVCTVREIERVWLYSLDVPGMQAFLEEMSGRGPIPQDITVASSPRRAVAEADIICAATTSSTPVFEGRELKPGTHVNGVGSFTPKMQEIDTQTVLRSLVVVDSRESAMAEAGDLIIPLRRGEISEDWIHAELGEIVNGTKPGRSNPEQVTFFKSVGVAVQDAAAAGRALATAVELGLGQTITL